MTDEEMEKMSAPSITSNTFCFVLKETAIVLFDFESLENLCTSSYYAEL